MTRSSRSPSVDSLRSSEISESSTDKTLQEQIATSLTNYFKEKFDEIDEKQSHTQIREKVTKDAHLDSTLKTLLNNDKDLIAITQNILIIATYNNLPKSKKEFLEQDIVEKTVAAEKALEALYSNSSTHPATRLLAVNTLLSIKKAFPNTLTKNINKIIRSINTDLKRKEKTIEPGIAHQSTEEKELHEDQRSSKLKTGDTKIAVLHAKDEIAKKVSEIAKKEETKDELNPYSRVEVQRIISLLLQDEVAMSLRLEDINLAEAKAPISDKYSTPKKTTDNDRMAELTTQISELLAPQFKENLEFKAINNTLLQKLKIPANVPKTQELLARQIADFAGRIAIHNAEMQKRNFEIKQLRKESYDKFNTSKDKAHKASIKETVTKQIDLLIKYLKEPHLSNSHQILINDFTAHVNKHIKEYESIIGGDIKKRISDARKNHDTEKTFGDELFKYLDTLRKTENITKADNQFMESMENKINTNKAYQSYLNNNPELNTAISKAISDKKIREELAKFLATLKKPASKLSAEDRSYIETMGIKIDTDKAIKSYLYDNPELRDAISEARKAYQPSLDLDDLERQMREAELLAAEVKTLTDQPIPRPQMTATLVAVHSIEQKIDWEKELAEAKEALTNSEREKEKLTSELKTAKKEATELSTQLTTLSKEQKSNLNISKQLQNQIEAKEKELKEAQSKLSTSERQVKESDQFMQQKVKELSPHKDKSTKLERDLSILKEDYNVLKERSESLERRRKELTGQVEIRDQTIKELENELLESEDRIGLAAQTIQRLQRTIGEQLSTIQNLEAAIGSKDFEMEEAKRMHALQTDSLKTSIDELKTTLDNEQKKHKEIQSGHLQSLSKLNSQLEISSEEQAKLQKTSEDLQEKLDIATKELNKSKQNTISLTTNLTAAELKAQTLSTSIESLTKEIDDLKETNNEQQGELNKKTSELSTARTDLLHLNEEIESLNEALESATKNKDSLEREVAELTEELDAARIENNALKEDIKAKEIKLQETSNDLIITQELLTQSERELETQKQQTQLAETKASNLSTQLNTLGTTTQAQEIKINELKEQLSEQQQEHKEIDDEQKQTIRTLQSQLTSTQNVLSASQSKVEELQKALNEANKQLTEDNQSVRDLNIDINEYQATILGLKDQIAIQAKELKDLRSSDTIQTGIIASKESALLEANRKLQTFETAMADLVEKLESAQKKVKESGLTIEQLNDQINKLRRENQGLKDTIIEKDEIIEQQKVEIEIAQKELLLAQLQIEESKQQAITTAKEIDTLESTIRNLTETNESKDDEIKLLQKDLKSAQEELKETGDLKDKRIKTLESELKENTTQIYNLADQLFATAKAARTKAEQHLNEEIKPINISNDQHEADILMRSTGTLRFETFINTLKGHQIQLGLNRDANQNAMIEYNTTQINERTGYGLANAEQQSQHQKDGRPQYEHDAENLNKCKDLDKKYSRDLTELMNLINKLNIAQKVISDVKNFSENVSNLVNFTPTNMADFEKAEKDLAVLESRLKHLEDDIKPLAATLLGANKLLQDTKAKLGEYSKMLSAEKSKLKPSDQLQLAIKSFIAKATALKIKIDGFAQGNKSIITPEEKTNEATARTEHDNYLQHSKAPVENLEVEQKELLNEISKLALGEDQTALMSSVNAAMTPVKKSLTDYESKIESISIKANTSAQNLMLNSQNSRYSDATKAFNEAENIMHPLTSTTHVVRYTDCYKALPAYNRAINYHNVSIDSAKQAETIHSNLNILNQDINNARASDAAAKRLYTHSQAEEETKTLETVKSQKVACETKKDNIVNALMIDVDNHIIAVKKQHEIVKTKIASATEEKEISEAYQILIASFRSENHSLHTKLNEIIDANKATPTSPDATKAKNALQKLTAASTELTTAFSAATEKLESKTMSPSPPPPPSTTTTKPTTTPVTSVGFDLDNLLNKIHEQLNISTPIKRHINNLEHKLADIEAANQAHDIGVLEKNLQELRDLLKSEMTNIAKPVDKICSVLSMYKAKLEKLYDQIPPVGSIDQRAKMENFLGLLDVAERIRKLPQAWAYGRDYHMVENSVPLDQFLSNQTQSLGASVKSGTAGNLTTGLLDSHYRRTDTYEDNGSADPSKPDEAKERYTASFREMTDPNTKEICSELIRPSHHTNPQVFLTEALSTTCKTTFDSRIDLDVFIKLLVQSARMSGEIMTKSFINDQIKKCGLKVEFPADIKSGPFKDTRNRRQLAEMIKKEYDKNMMAQEVDSKTYNVHKVPNKFLLERALQQIASMIQVQIAEGLIATIYDKDKNKTTINVYTMPSLNISATYDPAYDQAMVYAARYLLQENVNKVRISPHLKVQLDSAKERIAREQFKAMEDAVIGKTLTATDVRFAHTPYQGRAAIFKPKVDTSTSIAATTVTRTPGGTPTPSPHTTPTGSADDSKLEVKETVRPGLHRRTRSQ